jgi:hypothetical protein
LPKISTTENKATPRISSFNCCPGWGYIVAFAKVLTLYQIYHTGIHPLHCSPLCPLHSWNSLNRYHFCIYIHVYTIFVPYSPL